MEPKKVLFLDIDGVVITGRSHAAYGKRGGMMKDPDPVALAVLRRITESGVQLVISSTWRKFGKKSTSPLRKVLGGLLDQTHEDWATPDFNGTTCRGEEIADWLKRHPNVKDYAILDDDSDMLPEQLSHFHQTTMEEGASFKTLLRLQEWAKELVTPRVPIPKIDGLEMKRPGGETPRPANLNLDREKTR